MVTTATELLPRGYNIKQGSNIACKVKVSTSVENNIGIKNISIDNITKENVSSEVYEDH